MAGPDSASLDEDVFIQKIHANLINERYALLRQLGEGGHGSVFLARDTIDGTEVALKLEHVSRWPILRSEAEICRELQGLLGFPHIYWSGAHDDYRIMAMELLGPSLEDLFAFCDSRFSLKTTLLILDQLLQRLEHLHSHRYIHCDIKPQNCLLGSGIHGNVVYITDFGLADYVHPREAARPDDVDDDDDDQSRPTVPRLVGTARYASIRAHEGRAQSFKDDMESLGYMLIHFLRGNLPWQGLDARDQQEAETLVMQKKKSVAVDELCAGLPEEFQQYMEYVHRLRHGEMPEYAKMRKLFRQRARKEGFEYDHVFDWTVLMYIRERERAKTHG